VTIQDLWERLRRVAEIAQVTWSACRSEHRGSFRPMFQSPDEDLADLLKEVHSGKLQLPDFQRERKWDDRPLGQCVARISSRAMMVLEIGGDA
jgi:hypothetical protein